MTDERNIYIKDREGRVIPYPCETCMQPSVYGRAGRWFCLQHWSESGLWQEQNLVEARSQLSK